MQVQDCAGSGFVCIHTWVLLCVMQEAGCAYVIILMAVYWCTEALPLAVTALLPAVLFPLFGVMQSEDVSKPVPDWCRLLQ